MVIDILTLKESTELEKLEVGNIIKECSWMHKFGWLCLKYFLWLSSSYEKLCVLCE